MAKTAELADKLSVKKLALILWTVCLFVCLSAHITRKPAWSSSDGVAICYVLPVLWMTSCFT